MPITWRIIDSGIMSPAMNMAIDEAIMLAVIEGRAEPTIRFYDWKPATVSCGFNQSYEKEVDLDLIKQLGYGFVRRPTGGRVVLHKNEVTYSVIAPIGGDLGGSVTESYAKISQALAVGMNLLGVEVELEKGSLAVEHQRENSNPCFSSTSRYELAVAGKKIVGSAQVRKENVLLQHGSILLNEDQSIVADILPGFNDEKRSKIRRYLSRKTISINKLVESSLGYDEAVEALVKGFTSSWSNDQFILNAELSESEFEQAEKLAESKYLMDEWNLRK